MYDKILQNHITHVGSRILSRWEEESYHPLIHIVYSSLCALYRPSL